MLRRPPEATRTDTLFPYPDALPICPAGRVALRPSRALVRRAHAVGLREEGQAEPRGPHVFHEHGGADPRGRHPDGRRRSEEHTSELQSLMRSSYAVFCMKKKNTHNKHE